MKTNCIAVHGSIQCPQFVHSAMARSLRVPGNDVGLITRRIREGFGVRAIAVTIWFCIIFCIIFLLFS